MPVKEVLKIEVVTGRQESPSGIPLGKPVLKSEPCPFCVDNSGEGRHHTMTYTDLDPRFAAVLVVRRERPMPVTITDIYAPPPETYLCRSHGAMYLGEPKVIEVLGESK